MFGNRFMSNIVTALILSASIVLGILAARVLFRYLRRKRIFARILANRVSRFLIPATVAGALMSALLYVAHLPSNGPNFFTLCLLPFLFIGTALSGNVHQPSAVGFYLSMFLFFFA